MKMLGFVKIIRELFNSFFIDMIKDGSVSPVFIDIMIFIFLFLVFLALLKKWVDSVKTTPLHIIYLFIVYSTLYYNYEVIDRFILFLLSEYKRFNQKSIDFLLFDFKFILYNSDIFFYALIFSSLILIIYFILTFKYLFVNITKIHFKIFCILFCFSLIFYLYKDDLFVLLIRYYSFLKISFYSVFKFKIIDIHTESIDSYFNFLKGLSGLEENLDKKNLFERRFKYVCSLILDNFLKKEKPELKIKSETKETWLERYNLFKDLGGKGEDV